MYDYKGPCHIYYPKTPEQKEKNEKLIEQLNKEEIKAECREAFEKQERKKKEFGLKRPEMD